MTFVDVPRAILAIRPATADDSAVVARLAALDSAAAPTGALLLGVVDGLPLAALSVDTGAVVADPFSPTADLVALLRQRAKRLRAASAPAPSRRTLRERLSRQGVAVSAALAKVRATPAHATERGGDRQRGDRAGGPAATGCRRTGAPEARWPGA